MESARQEGFAFARNGSERSYCERIIGRHDVVYPRSRARVVNVLLQMSEWLGLRYDAHPYVCGVAQVVGAFLAADFVIQRIMGL